MGKAAETHHLSCYTSKVSAGNWSWRQKVKVQHASANQGLNDDGSDGSRDVSTSLDGTPPSRRRYSVAAHGRGAGGCAVRCRAESASCRQRGAGQNHDEPYPHTTAAIAISLPAGSWLAGWVKMR